MSYGQITLTTLQAQLAEKYDSAAFWTAEEGRLAFNEGLRVYNMLTGVFRSTATIVTRPDDAFIALPGSMTYRTRVSINGVPIEPANLDDMDNGRPHWRSEHTASGGSVPTSIKAWIPAGITLIFIWPMDHVGGTTLTIDGVTTAPQLVNPGDFIDLGQEELGPLLGYALHVLAFKEGGMRFLATMKYYRDFIAACAAKNERLLRSNLYRRVMGMDLTRQTKPLQAPPTSTSTGDQG